MVCHLRVHERLRQHLHDRRQLREGFPGFHYHLQEMQRAEQTVSRRILIQENDMSRLFAAEARVNLAHPLQHISVPDLCHFHVDPVFLCHQRKTEVGHNRHHDRILF